MISVLYVFLVFFLVFANGFFVASEFALVGVRRSRIEMLAARGSRNAKRIFLLLDNLNTYISATQLGITMASLALGWIGEPVFAHLLEAPLRGRVSDLTLHTISFAIAFAIITFLHIVLGELAPKTLALERAEKVAIAVSWPMQAFYKIFRWPIRMLDWSGTKVVRLFGLHPSNEHASVYTEDELRRLIDISRQSGQLKDEEQQLIHRVFEFSDAEVSEAMVPRMQVTGLPVHATLADVRNAFASTGYSRLPVYGSSLTTSSACCSEKTSTWEESTATIFNSRTTFIRRRSFPPLLRSAKHFEECSRRAFTSFLLSTNTAAWKAF